MEKLINIDSKHQINYICKMKSLNITGIRVLKLENGTSRDLKEPVSLDETILIGNLDQYRKAKQEEIQKKYGKNYFIDLIYKEL